MIAGAITNAAIDAGIQYYSSGQIDWKQTRDAALTGGVQGAITGPAGGLVTGVKSLALKGGIIVASDIAGGTVAEIAINDKSFKDAAFQSTFAALAGYGAGKMLGTLTENMG